MEQLGRNLKQSDFTRIPFFLFKLVGIRLFNYHPDEKKPLVEKFALFIVLTNLVPHFFFVCAVLFYYTFEDPIELTAYACYVGFIANSLCKMIVVWNGRFILYEAVKEMEKIFPKTDTQIAVYRLEEYYKKIELYMRTLTIYHFSTTTMFNFFPIAQSIFEYIISGGEFKYRFPFIIYYPFNDSRPIVYPLVYIYQLTGAYILSCFFLGSDLLLVSTVQLICMHFEYLANRITNFEPTGTDEDLNELKAFIQYHRNILDISFKINEVFNIAILLNYIASCGVICMIGFQITVGSEILDLFKFIAFLISSLVHVYFICYFGTNLLTMSSHISDAVFSHRWYLGNNKYKKMLPLLIARAHKPAFLTAFKFFIISMESFKTLVSTSYQFFTLIKTKYDEEA